MVTGSLRVRHISCLSRRVKEDKLVQFQPSSILDGVLVLRTYGDSVSGFLGEKQTTNSNINLDVICETDI